VIRYLTLNEVLELYRRVMAQSGGATGIQSAGVLESAIAQPRQTFGGAELYPDLAEKAAALGFSIIQGHPFVDGNKRVGHAAMETFLVLNGHEIAAEVAEQERIILGVAAGRLDRTQLVEWLRDHIVVVRFRGKLIHYDAPFDSVAENGWEVLR
jgi:death-on-curing protein